MSTAECLVDKRQSTANVPGFAEVQQNPREIEAWNESYRELFERALQARYDCTKPFRRTGFIVTMSEEALASQIIEQAR